jgi:4-hydroxy-2-oxoheptanedioate aldolase
MSDQTDQRFHDALATVVASCERHGVIPGIHANPALAAARREAGFRLITVGFDHAPVVAAFTADLQRARG